MNGISLSAPKFTSHCQTAIVCYVLWEGFLRCFSKRSSTWEHHHHIQICSSYRKTKKKPQSSMDCFHTVYSVQSLQDTRQNSTSPSIRKINPRSCPEKSYRESLRINLYNSCYVLIHIFNTFLKKKKKKKTTKLQDKH